MLLAARQSLEVHTLHKKYGRLRLLEARLVHILKSQQRDTANSVSVAVGAILRPNSCPLRANVSEREIDVK